MSPPWVFYRDVNQYNNRPPVGGSVWEESALTGVEDKKATSRRRGTCLPPLWCGCCFPGRRGCRSQVRMRSLFGFPTPEALWGGFFIIITDSSQKYRYFSTGLFLCFFMHMFEKVGKAHVCSAAEWKWCRCRRGWGSPRSLCLKGAFPKEEQRRRQHKF